MKSKYSDVTLSVPGPRRIFVKLSKLSLKSEKQNSFEITRNDHRKCGHTLYWYRHEGIDILSL